MEVAETGAASTATIAQMPRTFNVRLITYEVLSHTLCAQGNLRRGHVGKTVSSKQLLTRTKRHRIRVKSRVGAENEKMDTKCNLRCGRPAGLFGACAK